MNPTEKNITFDPNALAASDAGIFGLPYTIDQARVVVVPVPWEVTVSYGGGTLRGPEAILDASMQVDLYDPDLPDAWRLGVAMDVIPKALMAKSKTLRVKAEKHIQHLARGRGDDTEAVRRIVNAGCLDMINHVRKTTAHHLANGKLVALVGGDHSTPLGFMQALSERHDSFGILQIDAHADLRDAYEGFTYSHASIMFNALKIKQLKRIVQVGIRDYCEAEAELVRRSRGRVIAHYDRDIKRQLFEGKNLASLHRAMVSDLPREVYISFDIDGLDPKLCPHTGTPVPGGFEFEEALHLIKTVVDSGRRIIGLDVNEVSPGNDDWDANVGARLLFRMINLMARSNKITCASGIKKKSLKHR